ncbi:MAG: acyl carrier protein [Acidobacteriota bacterium]|nr:acyl carrier protein [Acidobacteriota bacterium]
MTEEQVRTAVQETLARVAPEAASLSLHPTANFRDQFEFDSMDFVSFVLALDKMLERRTPEADYPRLSSLAGCIAYLAETEAPAARGS